MAEQATRLKHGDNLFDKTWEGIWCSTLDDKTICGFFVEPLLKTIGNLLRRTAETWAWTGRFQSNLA